MAALGQRHRDDHTPFVYLTDKYLTPQTIITGYTQLKANDKVNDAGTVTLEAVSYTHLTLPTILLV